MAKTIQVFVNTGKDDDNQLHEFVQGSGAKGKPTRIKAVKGARYQLKDPALKEVGPEYIRSKRVGKNLHVGLDGSNEADLIIEGYYDEGYLADDSTGLYGKAEDGQIYEYIPEDPTPAGLAANLTDGAMPVSQVLGGLPMGEAFALSGLPLLAAAGGGIGGLLAGAALLGAAAIAANRNNGTNTTTNQTGGLSSDSDSGSSNTDGITNNKTPSYSGKASPGATVEVTINGKTYTTVADANGNYVVKIPATDALPDGTYTPKIKVTNTDGTTSTADGTPFTIDTSTTGTGGLTHDVANDTGSNPNDNITNNTKPTFSGTGEPGATVKLVVDGQTLTAVVGADGKWVASGPYTGNGLTGGQHAVVITFTDVAGNTSTVNAAPIFISTGVGNITLSVDAVTADNTISGAEASLNGNTDITGKASGEFKAGQIVTLTINGKTFSGPVDGTGAYKISVPTADLLADPDKTIAASIAVTDTAGNTGTVATTHPYLVDNTAPNANTTTLTIDNVTADNIVVGSENTAGATTNITGKAFGEFQANDVVTLTINGKTFTGKVAANGSYSISVPVADLVADPDTKIDATLAATDHVGNIGSIAAAHTYTTDTVGPTNTTTSVTVNPVTADNLINATEAGQATIAITGRVTGEFKAGDIVTLTVNGKTFTGPAAVDGSYSINVTTTELIADTDKTITSSVVAHDAAGNAGTVVGNSQTYLVDNTAPSSNGTTLIIDAVADDNIINLVESKIANTTVTGKVVGEFTVGDQVTLTINGHTYTAAVAANGTYSTSVLTSDLTGDAAKTITGSLAAHDAAGNTGTITATRPYIVDITPPDANPGTAAINVDPVTTDNLINSADAAITNTTITGTVTGEFKAGDIVTLKLVVNGTTKTYTGTAATDGSYSIPVLTSDLVNDSDKTIEASVAAHDAAGNVGTVSTTQIYAVDTTNPNAAGTALSVNPVTADNVINLSESGQTNTTITGKVTGVFTGGDVVTLTVNGNAFTGRVDANGNYSINVATADLIADTDKTIAASIVAHNSSGNAGTITDTQTYTVDTTPPSATTTTLTVDVVTPDNIVNGIEGATGAADIAITGKAAGTFTAGDAVTLTINNKTFTGNVAADGSYSINVPAADLVADSDKKIDASIAAHDAAGNLGTVTSARTYAVDTVAPTSATTALTIDPVTADNIINAAENGIANTTVTGKATGEFKSGDQVTLTINNKAYTGTVNATGNFSISVLTSDLVADADKTIAGTIAATDAAGNVAAAGAIKADHLYLVDTTGPSNATTALSVNVVATDDTLNAAEAGLASIPVTGKVTGEFVAGDVVTLTVNGKPFTGQVDASGNYSINVATADLIADTGKTIAASIVAHDTVGNAGTVSATHPYLVDTVAPSDSTTTISVNVITPDNIINSVEAGQTKTAVTGTVAGEFVAGDTVTITVNGHTATGTVAANGTYTVDVLTADLVAETGKTLTATVAAHDAAGNVGNVSTNHRYAVDTTAPNGGAALGLTIDPDTNNDGIISYTELSGATSLNVTATFDKTKVAVGDIVTFTPVSGTAQTVTLTQAMVDAGKVTVAFATPANGRTLDVTATLSDVAGNATVPARDTATLNNTNPNASATIDIAAITTDSGTAGDFVTNDTTLTYTGTLTGFTLNGDKVKVELLDASGAVVETQTVTPTSATTWTFTPTAAQAAGNYTLRATIVDAAGARVNATAPVNGTNGGQDTQLIVIDTVVPTTTVNITAISEDTGVSATDFITKDNNGLTVSATLSTALATGEKLFYSRDNGVTWIDITSSVSGTTVTHIDSLLTSTTTVQMRVQDVAGNVGSNDTQLITIDTVAPTPVVNPEDPLNPPAGKASLVLDPITADNIITSAEGAQAQVPVTGTARGDFTAGDTVTLTINNKTFTGTVASNGTFSINVPGADLLADSDAKVVASLAATDRAGNVGTVTDDQTYTVTTTAPNGGRALGLTIDADTNNDGLVNFTEIGNTNGTANTVLSVSATFTPSLVKVGDIITFTNTATGSVQRVTLTQAMKDAGVASTTFPSPGDNGTLNVKATITDGTLGNTGPEATDSATFDLSSLNPVTIRITTDANNNGAGDGILNTAEINGGTTASVIVTLPSDAKAGDVLVITGTGNPTQSITLSAAQITARSITTTFTLPANGNELKVTAQVSDAAGNTSNLATDAATVNTTPVGSPTVLIVADNNTNDGFINRAELGNATTLSVKTTLPTTTSTTAGAAVGDTITVTDGTTTQTHVLTQTDINNGFVTDAFAKPAEGGTINVSATLTKVGGNTSQPGTDSALLDTSNFADPTDSTKSGLTVIINTDADDDRNISGAELTATQFKVKATVTLPGQAAEGDSLTLNASGNTPRTIILTQAMINAHEVVVTDLTPTGNGTTFTVSASLVDRAGNATPTPDASDFANIHTSAPNGGVAPIVEITTDADNSGIVNATELNGATTFAVKGSFDKTKVVAGDQMVFSDGTTTKTVILTSTDIGNGFATTTFTKPSAEGGTLTVTAKLQDSLGNATPNSSSDSASLDTVAPNGNNPLGLTIDLDFNTSNNGTSNDGNINSAELGAATTTSLTATFDPSKVAVGDKVTFTVGSTTRVVTIAQSDIDAGKVISTGWALPADGVTMTATAVLKDAAGNVTPQATDTAKMDATAPNGGQAVGLTIDLDFNTSNNGTSNDGNINTAELGAATTTSLTATFDKTKVAVGDKVTFAVGSTTKVVTLTQAMIDAGKVVDPGWALPAEGATLTATAVLSDASGNATPQATDTAKLDTATPNGNNPVGLTIDLDFNTSNNGTSNDGTINTAEKGAASETSLTATFDRTKVSVGDKVTFTVGSTTRVVTIAQSDIDAGKVISTGWALPADGVTMTATAVLSDAAGNTTPQATDTAKMDATAPNGGQAVGLTIDLDFNTSNNGTSNDGNINSAELGTATTTSLTATFDPARVSVGDKVTFAVGSTTKVVTLTQAMIDAGKVVDTGWALPAEGATLTATAVLTDAAGNATPRATDTAKLDTAAPNGNNPVGLTIDLDFNTSNNGTSNDGNINSAELGAATTTSLTATFDPTKVSVGDKVTFAVGSTTRVVTIAQSDIDAGKVISTGWALPADGVTMTATAVLSDAAGNTTPQATDTAKMDITAPNGGVAVGLTIDLDFNTSNNGTSNDGTINTAELGAATTTSLTATFDKTKVAVGDKVTFAVGSTTKVVTLTQAMIDAGKVVDTGWALPADGVTMTATAVLKDAAGNATPQATDTAKMDVSAPNGGQAVGLTIDLDFNTSNNGTSNDGTISATEKGTANQTSLTATFDPTRVSVGDKVTFTVGSTTRVVTLAQSDIDLGKAVSTGWNLPADGVTMTATAVLSDAAGNATPTATDTAKMDVTAPNGGAAVGLTIDLDVPASNDGIISSAEKGSATETSLTATFDRTLVAVGDKVTFSDGTTTKVVTLVQADITAGKVVSTGWTLPNEGSTLNVTAVLTDAAGNATPQATDSARLDTTAPNGGVAPTVSITTDANDNGKVGTSELNGATTFTVQGDFDNTLVFEGDKLVFTAGGVTQTVVLTAQNISDGFATTTFAAPTNGNALTVNVLVQDAAGNQSPVSANDTATLDTTAPTLVISHNKTTLLAGETSTVTFTFSEEVAGFSADDIDATGAQGSVTGLTQSSTDPKVWTATFTPIANINDTTNVIKVANSVYTDVAGNNGTGDDSDNFEIKTEVPSVTITLADSALKAGETSLVTYTFSQTPTGFVPGDVTISGAQGTLSDPVQSSNDPKVWTATFTPSVNVEDTTNVISIAAGTYTNSAGVNGTEGTSANFVIDTKAPTLTIAMADSALVVGETSKVTFTFSEAPTGFAAADVTVPAGIGAISGLAATSNPLVWEALFTPATNVADTTNIISVAASTYTDAAGNNGGAAQTSNFTIDTTVPTVAVAMGKSALKGGETTTVTFTFSQTPTGFDVADVDMTGAQGALSNLTQSGTDPKVWTATFTPTAQVEDAVNVIKVTAGSYTNASGNAGTQGVSANFTIDTLPPSTTITIDAIDDNVGTTTGTVASGGVTDDTTPTVNGTLGTALATGETVHIFDNGVPIGIATINVGDTAFTFNDTRTSIVDGSNLKYTAKVFDAAGNSGTASNLYTATIRTTVPTITVTSVAGDAISGSTLNGTFDSTELAALNATTPALPVISGTTTNVEAGQTVTVTLNGQTYTTTTVSVSGSTTACTWSISVPKADALLLNHGNTYNISATVADVAGQAAADTDNKLVVDVAALDIPTVIDVKTNIHTPTLTGVAQKLVSGIPMPLETNDILEITIKDSNGHIAKAISATIGGTLPTGFTYTAGTKTWSYDTSAVSGLSLPDGTYEVIVLATDAVPNQDVQKADISTSELIIDSTAPVFSSSTTVSVAENIDISVAANAVVYTAAASDTTGNHGATFSLKAGVGDAAKFTIDAATGKVSIKESPNFEDPSRTNHQYTFTVVATDTFGNKSEQAVTLTVTNVNEAPVAVADTATAKEAGGTANGTAGTDPTGNVLTNDTDVDANDTKTVKDIKASSAASVTAVNASTTSADGTEVTGSFGKLKIGADGSYVYTVDNTNATVQALNTTSTALKDVFTYTVKDAAGLTSTATITVTVNGANDAPTVANAIADTTGTVGTTLTSYVLPANTFADVDDSTLTLSATLADGSALPSWLTFNASTRTFSGTPAATGTVSVKVIATDAAGLSANDTFDIVVGAANTAPVANPTQVKNAFTASVAPKVTITDNQSAATAANATDVTYTLTFSEAIKASTLTEADISVTNGTLKAGTLTKVSDTVWTVQATTPTSATSASGIMALTVAEGSYTNSAGTVGIGNTGTQAFGTLSPGNTAAGTSASGTGVAAQTEVSSSSLTTLNDGGWVVVYTRSTSSYFQRYAANGQMVGSETPVAGGGKHVTITETANGGFVIAAASTGTTAQPVTIQRYDASSNPVGPAISIASSNAPSITNLSDGGFVVTAANYTTGIPSAYRYDSNGVLQGSGVAFDTKTMETCWVTDISTGGFAVTWTRYTTNSVLDVYFQRFDATGAKIGSPTVVKANDGSPSNPSVIELSDGTFVVGWSRYKPTSLAIYTQKLDASGAIVGSPVAVDTVGTTGTVTDPQELKIETLVGGGYVATYMKNNSIVVQQFDNNSNPVGTSTTIAHLANANGEDWPDVTALPNGGYVVAYREATPGATQVYQKVFGPLGSVNTTGTAAIDIINGSDIADTIIANGGADIIHAAGGNDKVTINESNVTSLTGTSVIDGGTGVNMLVVANASAATTIDLTSATVAARLKNFSSIDLTGTQSNTLKLDWSAISSISGATDNAATTAADESKMLVVSGNAGDTVNLVGLSLWAVGASQVASDLTATYGSAYNFLSGHSYKSYTLNGATVFVDEALTLSNLTASTGTGSGSTGPVTSAKTVQDLFGPSFSDVDATQSFKGVAITSAGTSTQVSATGAHYEYSTDAGSTWTALAGGLTDSTAVFLAPTALIRFADAAGAAVANANVDLTARLVDTSGLTGTASVASGNTVDAHINGGSTAFSASAVTVGIFNTAPVASPTTLSNVFAQATAPKVTITDNQSASTEANATDVTYTLTFSEAVKAGTLTEADISVSNGTLKAGSLTQVSNTVWTVKATTPTAATSASGIMALTVAEGSYTNTAGTAGTGNSGVQAYGTAAAPKPSTPKQVSTTTSAPFLDAFSSGIETLTDGGWIVTYGSSSGAFGQRYDAAGNKVGTEITFGNVSVGGVTVSALPNGGFVVAYDKSSGSASVVQKYDANSLAVGQPVTFSGINTTAVAGLNDGGFVVTTEATTALGGANTLYRYDSTGALVGSAVTLDSNQTDEAWVTKLSGGGFVAIWVRAGDIYMQVFDASGSKVGGATLVNTTTANTQDDPSISELEGGGFVVTWGSSNSALTSRAVMAQRYDAIGNKVGVELTFVPSTTGLPTNSTVTGLVGGGFAVAYMQGTNANVQVLDANGVQVGAIQTVNTNDTASKPSVTGLPNGGFVVAYRNATGQVIQQSIFGPLGSVSTAGGTGIDIINGSDAADNIVAGGGADIIHAGGGDDKVTINESNVTSLTGTSVIDGGTGVNILTVVNASAATTIDLTSATVATRLKNFSSIDLTGTQSNTLKLDYKAITTMSGAVDNAATTSTNESKMLVVSGDAGDAVQLVDLASWNVGSSQTAASLSALYGSAYNFVTGHTYKAYTLAGATLFVDNAVTLNTLAASTGGGGAGTTAVAVTEAKTVQQLFGPSFTDTDIGQVFKGVAITSAGTSAQVSASGAHYEWSADSGTTWTALTAGLTESTAVFLAPTALVRFAAAAGSAVAVPTADLKAYLVDTSGLTNTTSLVSGNTTDASVNGGSTAFSDVPVVVSVVNSAPVPAGLTTVADPFGKANFEITPVGTASGYGTLNSTTIGTTKYLSSIANSAAGTGGFYIDNLPWLASSQAWSITNTSIDITISKPLPYVDVYFSNWDEATASSIQFKVNGTIYKFTGAELQNLAKVTTALASGSTVLSVATATYSADGTMFLGSTDAATKLGGSFRIPAPSGGITSFSILSQDPDGARFGLLATDVSVSTIPVTSSQTVSALFGGSQFSDVDALDKFKGVVITNAGATADITAKGKYQFSTDNGTTWTDLTGGLTDGTGVYLKSTDLVRYKSASATATAIKQNLVAHLVDTSTASSTFTTSGATVDVSGANSGGSTAVSSAAITIAGSTAPVVLDLNHDGVLSYGQVQMDVLGTGHLQQTAWAGAHDGVLVWDKQSDGQVHDNSQYAFAQYGAAGSTDLQGLAAGFDSNHDGVLDAKDAKFAQFAVWQDANQDGVVEAGEMHRLSDAGITAINLTSDGVVRAPNAQVVEAGHTTAQLADGSTMVVADAEFGVQALSYHIDTTAPDATKLVLTGAGMDLNLSTFAAKHGAIAEVDVSGTGANSIKLTLADLLQGTPHAALKITGDADDSANVNLADWTNTGNTVAQNGHTYAVYNDAASHTAQLLIDQNLVNAGHVI